MAGIGTCVTLWLRKYGSRHPRILASCQLPSQCSHCATSLSSHRCPMFVCSYFICFICFICCTHVFHMLQMLHVFCMFHMYHPITILCMFAAISYVSYVAYVARMCLICFICCMCFTCFICIIPSLSYVCLQLFHPANCHTPIVVNSDLNISSDSGILHIVLDPARAQHNGRPSAGISVVYGEESMACAPLAVFSPSEWLFSTVYCQMSPKIACLRGCIYSDWFSTVSRREASAAISAGEESKACAPLAVFSSSE